MGEAPALLDRQAFDVEREEVDVVGAGGEAGQQVGTLADVQAALHTRMARQEGRQEARRHRARFGLGGEQQRLLLRLAPGGELLLGAREAMHQLGAGLAQLLSRAGPVQAPAALLEERHLQDRKSTRLNSSHLVISYAV